jgi:hypothetical protein
LKKENPSINEHLTTSFNKSVMLLFEYET